MAEPRASLDGLNLIARDMDATLAFYRRLGLEIPAEAIWSTGTGAHHVKVGASGGGVDLDLDSPELAAHYNKGFRGTDHGAALTHIGFRVATREEVDELYEELTAAGHPGLQPPCDAFWGARHAIVEDPDGRPVGIMSPSDPARRTGPPNL